MTLMIALVGEQPQPNFLPVLHCHPNDVLLLYTKRTKPVYDRLAATLQQKTVEGKQIVVHELETDPYDIATIIIDLDKKLKAPTIVEQSLLFNLTGGTKAMSLAAYQIAQQKQAPVLYLQSEGRQNLIYRYIWNNQQLHLVSKEQVSEYVELHDLLDLQIGQRRWREDGPDPNRPGGGGLFEQALVDALRPHSEYEIMAGVKMLNEQNEEVMDIDVLIRYQNQYGIIEAKLGSGGGRLEGIRQLVMAARRLGTYTQTFYAITVTPTPAHEEIRQAFYIQPISLPTYTKERAYDKDRTALTTEEATELPSIIGNALKPS